MSKIHVISQEILVIHIAPAGSTQENNTLHDNISFSVLMLEKINLHQNGIELNFLLIGMASEPAISFRINPHPRGFLGCVPNGELDNVMHYLFYCNKINREVL